MVVRRCPDEMLGVANVIATPTSYSGGVAPLTPRELPPWQDDLLLETIYLSTYYSSLAQPKISLIMASEVLSWCDIRCAVCHANTCKVYAFGKGCFQTSPQVKF
jgi:hypothetical protein